MVTRLEACRSSSCMTLMSTLAARNKVEYVWRKVCHPIRFGDPHLSRDRPYDFAHDLLSQIGSSAFRFGAGKDPVLGSVVSHLLTPCPQCFRETGVISTSLSLLLACSVNSAGQIVGLAIDKNTGEAHGFLATPEHR